MSKTNMEAVSVFYQITDRLSANATLPFLSASRRANNAYGTVHTSGLADSNAGLNCWLFNPKTVKTGNVSLGVGLLLPTGKDNEQNNIQVVAWRASSGCDARLFDSVRLRVVGHGHGVVFSGIWVTSSRCSPMVAMS